MEKIKKGWFLLVLICVIISGYFLGDIAIAIFAYTNKIIMLIMFLIGLAVDGKNLLGDIKNFKAFGLNILNSYLLCPLVAFIFANLLFKNQGWAFTGLIIVGSTSCTLASAVVWTMLAKGNERLALVLSIFSNLISVVVIPFFLLIFLSSGIEIPFLDMVKKIFVVIIIPVIVAQIIRNIFRLDIKKVKKVNSVICRILILILILIGTARAKENLFVISNILLIVVCCLIHILIMVSSYYSCMWARVNKEDTIAIIFSSSQKTLTTSMMIALTYFEPSATIPIIIYHIMQLSVDSIFIDILPRMKWAR